MRLSNGAAFAVSSRRRDAVQRLRGRKRGASYSSSNGVTLGA